MLSQALREFTTGPLNQLIVNLGGEQSEEWENELKKFLRKESCWTAQENSVKILKSVTSVTVPGTSRFSAADHFKHGEVVDGVKCYLWDNFKARFGEKIEENVEGCEIRVHTLLQDARDLPIRAEIGEEREETKLAHLWNMLKLQNKGQKGALLTNGYANIFYIRDTEGSLWAVSARWSGVGWRLDARSVERPSR